MFPLSGKLTGGHAVPRLAYIPSAIALAVALLLLVWPATTLAVSYTFTKIADTSGPFARFDFGGAPAINDKGTVAFIASFNAAGPLSGGIFMGD